MIQTVCAAHYQLYQEDLPFWLGLARRQGGPVLELGCGSGRVMLRLARAGVPALGLDKDPAMLALLQQELAAGLPAAARAAAFCGDLTAFHLAQEFALILLPCNTYTMLEPAGRPPALACIRRHLAPGGLFAASMPNPTYLLQLARRAEAEVEEVFPHPLDGEPVQVSSAWERTAGLFTLYWHYDHLLPDGRVERQTAIARHQIIPLAAHLAEFQAAGLEVVETCGEFDGAPLEEDSPNLIILARR